MFKKIRFIFLLVLVFAIVSSCLKSKPSLEEQNAIKALMTIQNGVEADINLEAYLGLLNAAKADIDTLKSVPKKKNNCVLGAVEKGYAAYVIAGKAWHQKIEAKDEKRRQDMGMTFAFSLSFGSLNIEKANNCFNK